MIYPIFDSDWVSPVHVMPKKTSVTVVKFSSGELVPTRVQNGWRVCIDYRKLNAATRKDHFPLPFIDQMLERLAGKTHYCFLDGYSGFFQISHAPLERLRIDECRLGSVMLQPLSRDAWYGTPRALISDRGTHFCNKLISGLMEKYGVTQQIATTYHPRKNGQAEVSNREIKSILEKTVKPNRKD
ncbi:uncharacterized protein LOC105801057 [Gossypium raimondii]|uniref:uncharacterized protein LOC105801057 n=1 Tax=Gossypium raimondii TaxID=29730 RepID=UPI00063A9947|nr:uncharacterized protein LOC105801057 [Gossypium raimondii]